MGNVEYVGIRLLGRTGLDFLFVIKTMGIWMQNREAEREQAVCTVFWFSASSAFRWTNLSVPCGTGR
jgi:hypothetical protein